MFDKIWFSKHQKLLLKFANTFIGRWILCINGKRSSVGKNKIIKIEPNSITWKTDRKYHTEFRTHDKFGKRIFYAFKPIWYLCHLWDMVWYPKFNLGFDTYPDIFAAAGDGSMRFHDGSSTWADMRTKTTGTDVYGTDATSKGAGSENTDRLYLYRSFFPFDTSGLPDDANIQTTGTKLSIYATAKGDSGSTSIGLIQTTQASTSSLANTDYDNLTVNTPTEGCTRVTIASITTSAYNDFAANANLVGWISKTGSTLLGLRNSDDIDNSAPGSSESNNITHANSEQTGTSNDPKLVVTYTIPGGFFFISQ
jgi:hypothetical protein